jgi:hypothetical protein
VALTVQPLGDGDYQVDVEARRLADDSQWFVDLGAEGEDSEENAAFRPRADEGGWTVSAEMTADDEYWATFYVLATRSDEGTTPRMSCFLATDRSESVSGVAACGGGHQVLSVHRRRDGRLLLSYQLVFRRPETRWRLTQTTSDAGADRRGVTFVERSDAKGRVRVKAELEGGPVEPVIGMHAVSERGGNCWIRIEPGSPDEIETGPATPPRSRLTRMP